MAGEANIISKVSTERVKSIVASVMGGVPEAPQDGQQYARQNAAWSVVSGGGGGFTAASLAEAQAGTDNTKGMTPLRVSEITKDKSIGSIYNKSTWANLNDWDVNGTSPTVSSGEIVFSNSLTYDHYLTLKTSVANTTARENWYMSAIITNNTGGQGGYLGVRSVAIYNRSLIGFWNANTLGIQASSGTFVTLNTATLNASVGDKLFIDVRRQGNRVIVTGRNLTTGGASVTVTYTFESGVSFPTFTTPNTSRFCIGSFGNVTFSNLAITSTDQQGADIALIGDSITSLYSASNFSNTFANILRRTYDVVTFAGPSDSSTDALARLQEVIDSKPKNAIVFCWINDPGLGIATATTTANIDAIYTALNNAGINVIFMQYYSTAVSLTAIENHLTTNYPTRIIDPRPLMNGNGLIADGVHMNDQGNEIYAHAIKASGKVVVGKNYGGLKSVLDNTYMAVGGTVLNSTDKAIPYFNSNNLLSQDATNFVFDYTNKRLGIGTSSPTFGLSVVNGDYYQEFLKTNNASTIAGTVYENDRAGTNNAVVAIRGSSVAATLFGSAMSDWFTIVNYGANSAGMAIGSIPATPINFYTNNTKRMSISSTGTVAIDGGKLVAAASVTGYASLRLPHGTAPTTPEDGDMWTTTAGLFVRINGVTVGPLT